MQPTEVSTTGETARPPPDLIRDALTRVLASPGFPASERRRRFLSFIVEETLAGRAATLKGFAIAHAVFGRDETFDSQSDPVVRIEARRLRRDLDSYYMGPGAADPVQISIPKGSYVPHFAEQAQHSLLRRPPQTDAPTSSNRGIAVKAGTSPRRTRVATTAAALLAAVALLSLAWSDRSLTSSSADTLTAGPPKVVLLPFEPVDGSETSRILSAGLGSELVQNLMRFQDLRLYRPPDRANVATALASLRTGGGPAYVVRGEVHTEEDRASIAIQLLEGETDEVIWSETYSVRLDAGALIDLHENVSASIATALGQPYGPLRNDIRRRAVTGEPSSVESYLCVLQAYEYRRSFSAEEFAPVMACLEAAVVRTPEYADAWAMLGWLHLDAGRYGFVPPEQAEAAYAAAFSTAERALDLEADNVLALKALSSIHHHTGGYDEGEGLARRALELNPHDPDTLAQLGWRLAVRGKYDEGIPLLEEAIARSVDPPGWYYHLIAIHHFIEGDYERMREAAVLSTSSNTAFSHFLTAVAAGVLEDAEAARGALAEVDANPAFAADPEAFMRRHGATDDIVRTMLDGIEDARRLAAEE